MSQFIDSFLYNIRKEFHNVDVSQLIIYMIIIAVIVHIGIFLYTGKKKQKINISTEIMIILLMWYIGLVAGVTYFNRQPGSVGKVFQTKLLWWEDNMDQNVTNVLNIILFVPFGMLIWSLKGKTRAFNKIIVIICSSFLFGLIIEEMKYVTQRGYFEVDNIEGNIIGALIGAFILYLTGLIFRKEEGTDSEEIREK